MNVQHSVPSDQSIMGSLEQNYADGVSGGKSKSYPMQMYGTSTSSSLNALGYNLGTPSPPLTALSSRSVGNNGNLITPSPLNMPQFLLQGQQLQQQQADINDQSQQIQQHRQPLQAGQSHLQLQHSRQLQQHAQQHAQQQLQQILNQQQQMQQGYAQFEPHQKTSQPLNFNFHDTTLDASHFNSNVMNSPGNVSVNGTKKGNMSPARMRQMSQSYRNQDNQLQDPQLRLIQHLQQQPHQQPHQHQQQQAGQMQHQQEHQNTLQHQLQLDQQSHSLSNGVVHDPRLQGEAPNDRRSISGRHEAVMQTSQMHMHPQLAQTSQGLSGGIQMQHSSLTSHPQSPSLGMDADTKLGGQTMTIISKLVAATDEDGTKKKRGRPKKLILDPATNQYIDSSHENFKRLNKLLKQSTDVTVKHSPSSMENGIRYDSLNDVEMKQLLELKDRRGRPRKFPVEQTGITIKGVRVTGSLKRRRETPVSVDAPDKVKKRRGRPKRDTGSVA